MKELLETIIEIIIETIVCIFSIALIIYPLKKIRMWLAKQGIRIIDMWAYYTENRDNYFYRS